MLQLIPIYVQQQIFSGFKVDAKTCLNKLE